MSEVQSLVLFVEELLWCDVSTLELLGHLIAQSPTARVLLLATARPDFTRSFVGGTPGLCFRPKQTQSQY
jgi:predicted ATPase